MLTLELWDGPESGVLTIGHYAPHPNSITVNDSRYRRCDLIHGGSRQYVHYHYAPPTRWERFVKGVRRALHVRR